ncbi:unnamed protein product [Mesocestoides corti]|uniref:Uncharacterized protein n=1 Tax=Mesocestoides corti TaxID=53468 RepID=A0A0R3UB59_MESCO|nr:unnamed protein product [Mesocestoides corti]
MTPSSRLHVRSRPMAERQDDDQQMRRLIKHETVAETIVELIPSIAFQAAWWTGGAATASCHPFITPTRNAHEYRGELSGRCFCLVIYWFRVRRA